MEPVEIAFIVPAYNVVPYIDECIQSIIDCALPGDQIIVVNDGSTDGTEKICQVWQQRFPHIIKLINQTNQGLSAARNRAILDVGKKYTLFMDSDDVIQPESIHLLRPVLRDTNADIVVCDFHWWHPERAVKRKRSPKLSHIENHLSTQKDEFLTQTLQDSVLSACSRVFKTELIQSLGAHPFPVGDAYEEIATVPRLTARAKTLYYLPIPLFDYRVRPKSITTTKNAKHCLDLAKAMCKFNHELSEYTSNPNTLNCANTASAKYFLAAIRDCGMTSNRESDLYKKVIELAMASMSTPIEYVIQNLKASLDPADRKAASHLALATSHPRTFIYSRKLIYSWKSFRSSLKGQAAEKN